MRRHVLGLFVGILTFAIGVIAVPRVFYETGLPHFANELCSARNFSATNGEQVTLWSCGVYDHRSARDDFDFANQHYTIIKRSETRSVVSYFTGERTGFCVLRVDGIRRNDICSMSLEATLEFEALQFKTNEN